MTLLDLSVVTLTFKILSGPHISETVGWLGRVGMLNHGVTLNLGFDKVCSLAIFEIYFSYHKDIWFAVIINLLLYFYLIVLFQLRDILQLINLTVS